MRPKLHVYTNDKMSLNVFFNSSDSAVRELTEHLKAKVYSDPQKTIHWWKIYSLLFSNQSVMKVFKELFWGRKGIFWFTSATSLSADSLFKKILGPLQFHLYKSSKVNMVMSSSPLPTLKMLP